MQRATRSNADNTLVHVEDPEQIIRVRRRSMAEQTEQGVVNRNPRVTRDSDGIQRSRGGEHPRPLCTRLGQHTPEESHPKWNGTE